VTGREKTAMDEWVFLFASRDELAEEYAIFYVIASRLGADGPS